MPNAYFTIARPENDAFRGYLPGSKERAELKEELARQSAEIVKIPLIIGGKEIFTEKTFKVTMPHDHAHVIAECSLAGEKELSGAADALYVTAGIPVTDWLKVYVKWDEFRAHGNAESSHDMYSACLNFRLHKNLNFQLEYHHHNNKLLPTPQFNDLWFMTYIRF